MKASYHWRLFDQAFLVIGLCCKNMTEEQLITVRFFKVMDLFLQIIFYGLRDSH